MRLALFAALVLAATLHAELAFAGVPPVKVPEPASLAVAAVGVGIAAWAKFRRRR